MSSFCRCTITIIILILSILADSSIRWFLFFRKSFKLSLNVVCLSPFLFHTFETFVQTATFQIQFRSGSRPFWILSFYCRVYQSSFWLFSVISSVLTQHFFYGQLNSLLAIVTITVCHMNQWSFRYYDISFHLYNFMCVYIKKFFDVNHINKLLWHIRIQVALGLFEICLSFYGRIHCFFIFPFIFPMYVSSIPILLYE